MNSFLFLLLLVTTIGLAACGEDEKAAAPAGNAQSAPSVVEKGGTAATATPDRATKLREKQPATAPVTASGPAGATMAPTPASVLRETELKDKPFLDAKTLKRLPAKAAVVIVERSGGWLKVTSDGQQGWVRLLHVSSQPAGSSTARELESVAKIATGRGGSGNIVSTTGIRGLNEEQLRKAQADPEALRRLESYAVDRDRASEYARTHDLERRQLAYLPEPK